MDSETEIPEDVIAEIQADRKVNAIKLLRKHLGVDLKEAKQIVDSYVAEHPSTPASRTPETDTGIGRIIILALGVGAIYGIYKLLG
jgi:hypothetical protein